MAMNAPAPAPSAGPFGIPTKWIIIGGGAAALGLFFLSRKGGVSSASGTSSGDVATGTSVYGQALGPNAALALGDLQTKLLQSVGALEQDRVAGTKQISDLLSSQYGMLADSDAANYAQLATGQAANQAALSGLISSGYGDVAGGLNGLYGLIGRGFGDAATQATGYYNNLATGQAATG